MVEIVKDKNNSGEEVDLLCPSSFDFEIWVDTKNLAEITDQLLPILSDLGFASVKEWEIPFQSPRRDQGLQQKLMDIRKLGNSHIGGIFVFDDSVTGYFSQRLKERVAPSAWPFSDLDCVGEAEIVHFVREHTTVRDLQRFLQQAVEICRQVLQQAHVYKATLQRVATSRFAPATPIVANNVHLVLTTSEEVEASYTDPQVFWNAGWSSIEQFGDQFLLTRALDQVGEIDFKQEVYPHQWDLARAAKPGLTKYYDPNPRPEEEFLLYDDVTDLVGEGYSSEDIESMLIDGEVEGEFPRLLQVGYSESQQFVEYTCAIPPADHILPWEIYELRYLLEHKEIAGQPLKAVRVLFPNRLEAEKEKRPLLDIGAQVLYLDDLGEEQQLTE